MQVHSAPTPLEDIAPIVHTTLSAKVYRDMREMLMLGLMQPGERLTLTKLAAALGTSAMPVREAIQKLAVPGALEVLPNRSVRVPVMTRASFTELATVRCAIEGLAIEAAATKINARQLAQLTMLEEEFRVATCGEMDLRALIQANKQFHFTAYAASGMPTLVSMIETLWLRVGPVLNLYMRRQPPSVNMRVTLQAHADMLEALRQHDSAAARAALSLDIRSAAEAIVADSGLLLLD